MAHVCSATNSMAFPRKLKTAPTALSTITDNASTACPVSLLSASANLSNHPLSFSEEPHAPLLLPKAPVMARTIVEIVIERAASIENIVMPCSRKRV